MSYGQINSSRLHVLVHSLTGYLKNTGEQTKNLRFD